MPHEREREHHRHEPCVDPGSFLLGEWLRRLEAKIDALGTRVAQLRLQGAATAQLVEKVHERVEQIAVALDIGREAASLTFSVEPPRPET